MAERKATNKYYPPEWDPSKGSINKFVGQHPLRERARKLDQGILIVRFELPYNVWCLGCDAHVGMGVRFNAEKKKIGNYYSTPILSFRMKCHLCSHWWDIHTDPKNTQYVCVSGVKQKDEEWDPEENGTLKLLDDKERAKIQSNPLSKLEHTRGDERRADAEAPIIEKLQDRSEKLWGDVYAKSKLMRKKFRVNMFPFLEVVSYLVWVNSTWFVIFLAAQEEKKIAAKEALATEAIRNRNSLHINLLPESLSDAVNAKAVTFNSADKRRNIDLKSRLTKPLFNSSGKRLKSAVGFLQEQAVTNSRLKHDPFVTQPSPQVTSLTTKFVKHPGSKSSLSLVAYDSDD